MQPLDTISIKKDYLISCVAGCQAGGPLLLSRPIDTGLALIKAEDSNHPKFRPNRWEFFFLPDVSYSYKVLEIAQNYIENINYQVNKAQ